MKRAPRTLHRLRFSESNPSRRQRGLRHAFPHRHFSGRDCRTKYTYDLDGNLTRDGRFAYAWDAENRLVGAAPIVTNAHTAKLTFTYDYMGRRVSKVVSQWTGSAWAVASSNVFIYDGWNLVCERSNPVAGSPTTNFYCWGLDLSGPTAIQGRDGAAAPEMSTPIVRFNDIS